MKAVKGEEIIFTTDNKTGKLEELTRLIEDGKINIRAISAYVIGDSAFFRLLTSDNAKTKNILKTTGKIESKEVIIVEVSDDVGQLHNIAYKLKSANIDLTHIYGTTYKPQNPAIIVFSSNNNDKALEVITA